ncbi:multiple epidermal growth factor-like domains protein 10 [Liolophura sinensis]|uniref:multiple epidermal growth factor-like domains protein 10 n=1 Tax=Liolophura sinensis TaxID=3198878 RepID=UPI00315907DB
MEKIFCLLISIFVVFIMPLDISGQCNTGPISCQLTCRCNTTEKNCLPDHVMGCGDLGCQPGWSGPTCQRENIAFLPRNVDSSSEFHIDNIDSMAFDGNLSTVFRSREEANPYLTAKTKGWNSDTFIYSIRIYNGATDLGDLSGFEIYVSKTSDFINSKLCYRDNTTIGQSEYVINCTQPLTGPYFKLRVPKTTSLAIREMEINNCADYWFGDQCNRLCNCRQGNHRCDGITGDCPNGCLPGFNGTECYTECPEGTFGSDCNGVCHCKNESSCDKTDGTCDFQGCAAGYKGKNCESECYYGDFGEGCQGKCHCYLGHSECNRTTGHCGRGCQAGYTGDNCQQECVTGRYHLNCEKICHCKNRESCNKVYGTCDALGCEPGYQGPSCYRACETGRFGEKCQFFCHCKNPASCNHANGTCDEHGCAAGYKGHNCQEECSTGRFGDKCENECHCKNLFSCNHVNGTCDESACAAGYKGDICQETVDSPTNSENQRSSNGLLAGVIVLAVISAAVIVYAVIATVKGRHWYRSLQQEIKSSF